MSENKRWITALVLSLLLSFGGNYWVSTINQARVEMRVEQVEKVLIGNIININKNSDNITNNIITLNKVNQGWGTVAKAVEANTAQLTKFTEVLIRLEERDKLKN